MLKSFDLEKTLNSGQIFRYRIEEGGAWICHRDNVFFVTHEAGIKGMSIARAREFFRDNQPPLKHDHPVVQRALEFSKGMRIIRQDPWECLVAFIISQNNHQKRIATNLNSICERFGQPLEEGFYSMPLPEEIGTEEELKKLGLGYRAKYISKLKNIDLAWLYGLIIEEYEFAKQELMKLEGVGPKVADCILLFSLGFDQACPEDTWIKKFFTKHQLSREQLGEKAGLLQQFIFHASRERKI